MIDIKWERQMLNTLLRNWEFPFDEECAMKAKLWELNNLPHENIESLAIEYCYPPESA